jgi:ATP-dependent RNA circularization protein (DNA/RNA ligase family)
MIMENDEGHTGIVIAGNPRKFPAIWYRTSASEIVKMRLGFQSELDYKMNKMKLKTKGGTYCR